MIISTSIVAVWHDTHKNRRDLGLKQNHVLGLFDEQHGFDCSVHLVVTFPRSQVVVQDEAEL